jgi:hypothetical protein
MARSKIKRRACTLPPKRHELQCCVVCFCGLAGRDATADGGGQLLHSILSDEAIRIFFAGNINKNALFADNINKNVFLRVI